MKLHVNKRQYLNFKESFKSSLHSTWVILKLIVPFYILAEVLYFYDTLSYVSFLVEPMTSMLGLPNETAMSLISGMFLNLYAAIAFAAPLDLTPKDWTILAVFLGVCHALIVETAIMKKIGISSLYSFALRISLGFLMAYCITLTPDSFYTIATKVSYKAKEYADLLDLFIGAFKGAIILSAEVSILICFIIFLMDLIKSREFIKKSQKNVSKIFSIIIGLLLGITYGAGLLIKEAQSSTLSKKDIFYIGTFLMICHSIIEDTLLFVIFGANAFVVISIRLVFAFVFGYILNISYNFKKHE